MSRKDDQPGPVAGGPCRLCAGGPHDGHKAWCRDERRRDLEGYTKQQIVRLLQSHVWSAKPLSSWRKDELVTAKLDHEYPAPANVSSPPQAPTERAAARDETRPAEPGAATPAARDITREELAARRVAAWPTPSTPPARDATRELAARRLAAWQAGDEAVTTRCARPGCTELIKQAPTGRPARYHSPACRQAAHRDRTRRTETAGRRAAELADARDAAAVFWPQIEPTAADVADIAMSVVFYAATEDPEDRGALALKLAELRATVDQLESLATSFRAADDRAAALSDHDQER
jgi:hypothetical protein